MSTYDIRQDEESHFRCSRWRPVLLLLALGLSSLVFPVFAETCRVGVTGASFSPISLSINVGDSVEWENREQGFPHTTTSDLSVSNANYWSGVMGGVSDKFAHTFSSTGTFTYHDERDLGAGVIHVNAGASLRALRKENGPLLFDATGLTAGTTNVLQGSTNLSGWIGLSTNVATGASMNFTNSAASDSAFFRLSGMSPPPPIEAPYRWTCESPAPQGQSLFGVSALDASNVWAVGSSFHGGADGAVIHYNGTGWCVQVTGLDKGLFGVCALNSSNVWAVGADGAILHYDGARWRPQSSGTTQWLYGVSALDISNVWAVGHAGVILHYNGTAWSPQDSGTAHQLHGVEALETSNVWAVGALGAILHYDGTRWSAQDSGCTALLRGVSAADRFNVWAVGGTNILHYNGVEWVHQTAENACLLSGVVALSPSDVWAVHTDYSPPWHYDGTHWSRASSSVGSECHAVSGLDHDHVWMVSLTGKIIFFDGSQMYHQDQTAGIIRDISASAPGNAWAVGLQCALHYNGLRWTTWTGAVFAFKTFYGVSTLDTNNVWAVGAGGAVLHYDGLSWTARTSGVPASVRLKGVYAQAADQVWAVGSLGSIFHFDGWSWTGQVSGTTRFLHAVAGCDRQHVWAVGEGGTILRFDGTHWATQTSGTAYALYDVTVLNANQAWAVGAFGTVLQWDGVNWMARTSGVSDSLWGVSALDASNMWAVGGAGLILHWNGVEWRADRRGYMKQDWFWSVAAADTNHVWGVGENGSKGLIVRGEPGGRPVVASESAADQYEPWAPPGETLPAKVDLRGEMPPIGDQSSVYPGGQSCGPWAIAYYQLTQWIKHFKRPHWDLARPEYQMSPGFIYRYGPDEGALGAVTNYGCTDMAEFPYDPSFVFDPFGDQYLLEAAKPFRVREYQTLWHHEEEAGPYPDADVVTAKTFLANGYVLSAEICTEYGDFPDNALNPPAVFYDPPGKSIGCNHWVVLCGYDDNINPSSSDPDHRGGFLLGNCWGNWWNGGMRGYLWISYAWVKNYVQGVFVLHGNGPNGPSITNCVPTSASAGDSVTLAGREFGVLRRQARVTFNGLAAPVMSYSNETITVTVPTGAVSGPLIVYDWEGVASNPVDFQVNP
jgi:plastocyanin